MPCIEDCILLPSSTSTTSLLDRNAYIGNLAISLLPLKEIQGDEERVGDGDAFEFDNMLNTFSDPGAGLYKGQFEKNLSAF